MKSFAIWCAVLTLFALAAAGQAEMRNSIPNGNAADSMTSGITCQYLSQSGCADGAEENQFGKDFKAAGSKWTPELCNKDSDGDGVSNGRELGDPCCHWSPSNRDPPGFRVTNLSHPGDKDETGSKEVPGCPPGEENQSGPAPKNEKENPQPKGNPQPKTEHGGENQSGQAPKNEKENSQPKGETANSKPSPKSGPKPEAKTAQKGKPSGEPEGASKTESKTMSKEAAPKKNAEGTMGAKNGSSESKPPTDNSSPDNGTCYNAVCSKSGPGKYGGKPCCAGNQCTHVPWEGASAHRCLPAPPKCYNSNERCAGAPGKPYVPYAGWYVFDLISAAAYQERYPLKVPSANNFHFVLIFS